jgi:hypothetical protein
MELCLAPSQTDSKPISAFGTLVEAKFVRPYYCQDKGGCSAFPIGKTDFFDDNFSGGRCRGLSTFLEQNNPALPVNLIRDECEIQKPDTKGRFLIPDIITHQPSLGLFEFYEVKPNSKSGLRAGKDKVLFFEALCGINGLPYVAGTNFKPNIRKLIWDGTWLGSPFKAFLHIFKVESGLIVYEICIESSLAILQEVVAKALIKFLIAALILLLLEGTEVEIPDTVLALNGSVGLGGNNNPQDVTFVQLLLNDWRVRNGRQLIATDGLVGQNTLGAIADFQTNITGVVDRLIGIDGVAIRQLESIHLSTVTAQPGIDWIAVLPELAEIAAIFNQDAELVAASRTEFESSALDYLTALSGRDIGEVGVA